MRSSARQEIFAMSHWVRHLSHFLLRHPERSADRRGVEGSNCICVRFCSHAPRGEGCKSQRKNTHKIVEKEENPVVKRNVVGENSVDCESF